MISKGDIKDILLVLLLAAIAAGISAGAEYLFYEYLYNDNNIVEESREEISLSSFCYPSRNKDMQPVTKCRSSTPEFLMKLHGFMPTRRV